MITRSLYIIILCLLTEIVWAQSYQERLSQLENKALSHFYTNKDSVYFYYDKIYELSVAHGDFIATIDHLNYLCVAAGYAYDTDKIETTLQTLDSLIHENSAVLDTLVDSGDYQKNYTNYNKGNYYHKLEDYQQAQLYFEEIVSNITKTDTYKNSIEDLTFLSTCYSFIADINAEQDRFKVADEYYQKNIRLFKEYMPTDIEGLHKVYNLYASSLYFQKKYATTNELLRKTLAYAELNFGEEKRNSIVSTSLLLAKSYGDIGIIDSAHFYMNKIENYKIPNDPFTFRYLAAKGDLLAQEGKYAQAEKSLLSALEVSPAGNKPALYHKLGNHFAHQKKWDKALFNYQNGLKMLTPGFSLDSIFTNPSPSKVGQKQELFRLFSSKLAALTAKGDLKSLRANQRTIDSAMVNMDLLKPKFKNEKDKAFLVEAIFPALESGIEALYLLQLGAAKESHYDRVFTLFEKSKSVVLLGALLSSQANKFSQIPDQLLAEEKRLRSAIAVLEKKIDLDSNPQPDLENRLFKTRSEYLELIEQIENDYESYYNLKYNSSTQNLGEFQESLDKQTLVISYFYGAKAIYAIGISRNDVKLHKISNQDGLSEQIISFHTDLKNPKSDIQKIAISGKGLFDKLVSPFVNDIKYSNLVIMPDGPLNYLPFGTLNTSENGIAYLVEKGPIAYVNSASLLKQLSGRSTKSTDLLAVAPSFDGVNVTPGKTREALLPLVHNRKEVSEILAFFDGQSLLGSKGSLQNFKQASNKQFGILHLATHAVFDDTNPEYSYLAFTPNKDQDFLLYVRDLYNVQLQAELVTLSACETGIGELRKGEGFIGLARGFYYSGAISIASTLWKVNDASSAELMSLFYKNMADGNPKDMALQMAKLEFLKNNDQNDRVHPYYWSGFVISGNTRPLGARSSWTWKLLLGAILLIPVIVLYKRNRITEAL